MMKHSTFAGTALATLLAVTIGPAPAADMEGVQQQTQSTKPYRYMGNAPTFDSNADGSVSSDEFQTHQQRQRERHQQQYELRQRQMHPERINIGGPGEMGKGPGGGRR
jgi:hypothetical protein